MAEKASLVGVGAACLSEARLAAGQVHYATRPPCSQHGSPHFGPVRRSRAPIHELHCLRLTAGAVLPAAALCSQADGLTPLDDRGPVLRVKNQATRTSRPSRAQENYRAPLAAASGCEVQHPALAGPLPRRCAESTKRSPPSVEDERFQSTIQFDVLLISGSSPHPAKQSKSGLLVATPRARYLLRLRSLGGSCLPGLLEPAVPDCCAAHGSTPALCPLCRRVSAACRPRVCHVSTYADL